MQPFLQFFGRLHPMVLHAPIGILLGLVALEVVFISQRRPVPPGVRSTLVWLAALSAAVTAGAGYVLSLEDAYDRSGLQWHQWLGIGCAAGCLLAAILQQAGRTGAFRAVLFLTAATIIPAGHLGASVTHGAGFLTAPFTRAEPEGAPPARGPKPLANSTYSLIIAPIFESKCTACHDASRHKGGLSLESPDGIQTGGRNGPALLPGDAEGSEMVRRLSLPLDDDDHMPPKAKAQPSAEEVRRIADWIRAGARFDAVEASPGDVGEAAASETTAARAPEREAPAPAPAENPAVRALRDRLVHVEPIERGSTLLVVDFAAVAKQLTQEQMTTLLEPLREQVADLSIARSSAGDDLLRLAARMPNLVRLNAAATGISDAGVAALAGHERLRELVLTQDHLTDAAVASLVTMPALKRVYVWKAGIDAGALEPLRERGVIVDAGQFEASAAVERETEVKLSGEAPVAGQPGGQPAAQDALKPVNTVCPVSGKPIDPNFAVVYKGRVIGFCCAVCASQFLADPAKYEAQVH